MSRVLLTAALLVCVSGCAGTKQSRGAARIPGGQPTPLPETSPLPPSSGGAGGPTFVPGGSSLGGSPSGPTLLPPEARANKLSPQTTLHAPAPRSKTARYRPTVANPISSTTTENSDELHWHSELRSTDRRPIETLTIGQGARRVAVLGSMHGDEPQSVALVTELARSLKQNPDRLAGSRLLIIRSPNPDGSFTRSALNVNGVDINRNFPSHNWKSLTSGKAGAHPACEAETLAIMRLLREFEPQLVIHVKDYRGIGTVNFEGVNREGTAAPEIREAADRVHYDVVVGMGAKTSGSLESFVTTRMQASCLTLLLPSESSPGHAWERNQELFMACLSIAERAPIAAVPAEETQAERLPLRRKALPVTSSKTPAETRQNDFPAPVPQHGYLELPPPPEM